MTDKLFLRKVRHDEFVRQLNQLEKVDFPENRKVMREAMITGSGMHDNAGYDMAAQHEKIIMQRIDEIKEILSNAEIIEEQEFNKDCVFIGACVKLINLDTAEECHFTIGGAYETDENNDVISYLAPVAQGLLGKKVNEVAEIKGPEGDIFRFKILNIERAKLNPDTRDAL